jgi:hypothetical protein
VGLKIFRSYRMVRRMEGMSGGSSMNRHITIHWELEKLGEEFEKNIRIVNQSSSLVLVPTGVIAPYQELSAKNSL